jgi:prenyltransferase beta subunit
MKSYTNNLRKKNFLKIFVILLGLAVVIFFNLKKPLKVEEAWQKIYKEDILLKPHPNRIEKYFNEEKYVDYVKKLQTNEGYLLHNSPMVYEAFDFSEILNCIEERPTENTINYIKSLQVGTIGFSETSGETPWTSKADLAVPMFVWFSIPVANKTSVANFYKSFQNTDGGFGSITNDFSTVEDTLNTINILSYLNEKPKDAEAAIKKIKSYYQSNRISIFDYVSTLKKLEYNFNSNEEIELVQKLNSSCKFNPKSESLATIVNCLEMLQSFGESIEKYRSLTENLTVGNNVYSNSALCKIYRLFNMTGDVHDKLLFFVKENELPQGGFKSNSIYVLENSFAQQTMFLLGRLDEIDNNKFVEWLLNARNDDGWGSAPKHSSYHVYTSNAIISLRISTVEIPNKYGILNRVENELSNSLSDKSSYSSLRAMKEVFDRWMLLEHNPRNIEDSVKKVLSFWNEDGGFGNKNLSYMYATEWGVRTIYLADKFLTYRDIQHEHWLEKIKERTAKWIISAQNTDGGFGVIPNQPSNMQSTFLAIRSLYLLNEKPEDIEKAIKWIASHQKADGGFAGSLTTSSDLLFTYYSIGSVIMLDEMKGKM